MTLATTPRRIIKRKRIQNSLNIPERIKSAIKIVDGCWEWQKALHSAGYGVIRLVVNGESKACYAHRVSYECFVGPIPDGLVLDHLCRNPKCVNPAHLEPVTTAVNILRGVSSVAQNARKRRCINGHEYTEENTKYRRGHRECVICTKEASKRGNEKQRQKRLAAATGPKPPKTHCKHGHEFTPENTILEPGRRVCRICRRAAAKRSEAARTQRKHAARLASCNAHTNDGVCESSAELVPVFPTLSLSNGLGGVAEVRYSTAGVGL